VAVWVTVTAARGNVIGRLRASIYWHWGQATVAIRDQDRRASTRSGWRAKRRAKLLARLSSLLGEPVSEAAPFWVEGTLPFYLVGLGIGVAVMQGAVGAIVGLGLGIVASRLFTRRRAPGFGFQTYLAVTPTKVVAVKSNYWLGRPTGSPAAAWPTGAVRAKVRPKQLTTAVTLDLPEGGHVRLETPPGSRKRCRPVLRLLQSPPSSG
jgi:hypothetical protein